VALGEELDAPLHHRCDVRDGGGEPAGDDPLRVGDASGQRLLHQALAEGLPHRLLAQVQAGVVHLRRVEEADEPGEDAGASVEEHVARGELRDVERHGGPRLLTP